MSPSVPLGVVGGPHPRQSAIVAILVGDRLKDGGLFRRVADSSLLLSLDRVGLSGSLSCLLFLFSLSGSTILRQLLYGSFLLNLGNLLGILLILNSWSALELP